MPAIISVFSDSGVRREEIVFGQLTPELGIPPSSWGQDLETIPTPHDLAIGPFIPMDEFRNCVKNTPAEGMVDRLLQTSQKRIKETQFSKPMLATFSIRDPEKYFQESCQNRKTREYIEYSIRYGETWMVVGFVAVVGADTYEAVERSPPKVWDTNPFSPSVIVGVQFCEVQVQWKSARKINPPYPPNYWSEHFMGRRSDVPDLDNILVATLYPQAFDDNYELERGNFQARIQNNKLVFFL